MIFIIRPIINYSKNGNAPDVRPAQFHFLKFFSYEDASVLFASL
jgi:hypothetical protein